MARRVSARKPIGRTPLMATALGVLALLIFLSTIYVTGTFVPPGIHLKPNRVLVVTGTQMRDDKVVRHAGGFGDIVALLKLWGIPFDTLRLDLHSMTRDHFVDASGNARYGTIVWTLTKKAEIPWQEQDMEVLVEVIREKHISLIAVGHKMQEAPVQKLLGLSYKGFGPIALPVLISGASHFISRGLDGVSVSAAEAFGVNGAMVSVSSSDVATLALAGEWPQLTVRTLDAKSRTYAVWIGGESQSVFSSSPTFIKLLQRALVHTQGYGLYKEYRKSVVLRLDDPGAAQNAYLSSWRYPVLTENQIQERLIEPLQKYSAKLGVGTVVGFPWVPTRQIVHSAALNFIDPFGTRQNIVSMAAGMRKGIAAGVLEMHSHGFTHLVPDLETPVKGGTNWWNGSIATEWGKEAWYREFYDTVRSAEIPAETQKSRLMQSAEWIASDYGARALTFIAPGHAISGDSFGNDGGIGGGGGRVTLSLQGVSSRTEYSLMYGNGRLNWIPLGTFTSDEAGNAYIVLPVPGNVYGLSGGYFSVSRPEIGTQFIAGPTSAVAGSFNYSFRDHRRMAPVERAEFYLANEVFAGGTTGTVAGFATGSYKPMHISPNYTYKIAAEAGYGLALDRTAHYLGSDYVITLPACVAFDFEGNFSRGVPAVFYFHDSDLIEKPDYLATQLASIDPQAEYLSMDEWTAYLHADLDVQAPNTDTLKLSFAYDSIFERYFGDKVSEWTLHFSDETLHDLRAWKKVVVEVDGSPQGVFPAAEYFQEKQDIQVPAGAKVHSLVFRNYGGP